MMTNSTIHYFRVFILLAITVLPCVSFAQLDADLTTTDNTNCDGAPCDYNGPSILINEIMMSPTSNDGSLWGGTASQRGEWIELYNPNICESIDISCYHLGNNANDGGTYPGGYIIPPGTVVPAAGFALIRGVNADPVPANLLIANGGNVVELVVDGTGVCVGGGSRLWFPNSGGWFAFYDNNGIPQDAVSWANQSNTDLEACVPDLAGCDFSGTLPTYDDFPNNRKNYILNVSASDFQGQSIRRMPDGAVWSGTGVPTYATNNQPPPIPPNIICNGEAMASPFGGTAPYTYLWDDPQAQTTQVADSLCAGDYCVVITDALNNSIQQCITVVDITYDIHISEGICEGDSFTLPDNTVVTDAGAYPVLHLSGRGCDSLVTIDLEVYPKYEFELNPQICDNQTYTLPDGTEVNTTDTYEVIFQSIHGCDSIYTVNLTVTNPINIAVDTLICEGSTFNLPDGSPVTMAGLYQVLVAGDPGLCDTLFSVNLGYHSSYLVDIDNLNNITCFGENDGTVTLSPTGVGAPYSFDWSDGIDHGGQPADLEPGDYIITVSDVNGCEVDTSFSITEPLPVEIQLNGDTLICIGGEANLLAHASGGTGAIAYNWAHTDADSGNIAVSPLVDTNYTVYAEDENGCASETVSIDVAVISMDIGLLTISNDTSICPGMEVSLFGNYNGAYPPYTYTWEDDIKPGPGPHLIQPTEPSTYTLTVTDNCGNAVSADVDVNFLQSPQAIIPDQLMSGCSPLAVELFDPFNTSSGFTHEWVLSNDDSYFGNPASFVLDESGIVDVSLVVTSPDGCSTTSENTMPIEVYEVPVASFSASTWSTGIDEPDIVFTDHSTGGISSTWNIDGDIFIDDPEVNYTFPDTGGYAVQLVVENEFGCQDSILHWVNITIVYDVDIPNAFTPSAGGDNPYYDPTSTTNSVFYPFSDYVDEYQLSIFNRWGELIFESTEQAKGWNGTYRDKPCPQDVYVYKVEVVFSDGEESTMVGDITLFR